ncbi:MAG: hypothetical protein ABSE73_23125 [Planctomycetota bacterium]
MFAILEAAYGKLDFMSHQGSDEDTITQRLQEGAEEFVTASDAPSWAVHFDVVDQRKDNSSGAIGKERPILDLVFTRVLRGHRPRFTFEAKRLYGNSGAGKYLGMEGLGAYLDGTYRQDDDEAGMLGYVQSDTPANWAAKIEHEMTASAESLAVCPGGAWQAVFLAPGLQFSYRSRHEGPAVGAPITMYHVLLAFC